MTDDDIDREILASRERIGYNVTAPICHGERAIYRAGFAAGAAEVERLRDLLSESGFELARSLIFVGSRQQMHPDGITLYKQLVDRIDAALKEGK